MSPANCPDCGLDHLDHHDRIRALETEIEHAHDKYAAWFVRAEAAEVRLAEAERLLCWIHEFLEADHGGDVEDYPPSIWMYEASEFLSHDPAGRDSGGHPASGEVRTASGGAIVSAAANPGGVCPCPDCGYPSGHPRYTEYP